MDPTINLITKSSDPKIEFPQPYKTKHQGLKIVVNATGVGGYPKPVYVDPAKYNHLGDRKDMLSGVSRLDKIRSSLNPYEGIGKSIFINRAAVKLANICAVFNLIDGNTTTFSDLAGGPGGFVQYIQYVVPQPVIYGMTLTDAKKLSWSDKIKDSGTFNEITGQDGTGNLYTNWNYYIDMLKDAPVDLTTADGGFDVEKSLDFRRQEFLSSRLIFTEITVGLATTRVNGSMVIKVFDTVTKFSADMIFILTQCFEEVYIFKPVSSRPASAEKYLVCKHKLQDTERINKYLKLAYTIMGVFKDTTYVTSIFESLPQEFETWLIEHNNLLTNNQLIYVDDIIDRVANYKLKIASHTVDVFKAPMLWGIPNTPDPKM